MIPGLPHPRLVLRVSDSSSHVIDHQRSRVSLVIMCVSCMIIVCCHMIIVYCHDVMYYSTLTNVSRIFIVIESKINNFGSFCERMNNFGSLQLLEPSWAPGPNQNGSSLTKSDHFGPSNLGSAEELGPNLIGSL